MSAAAKSPVVNRIMEGLPRAERVRLLDACEPVDLVAGAILCEPGERYDHAWFPTSGFISVVVTVRGRPPLEVGLIGNEGVLGATLALGVDAAPLRGIVLGSGTALRITASKLRREMQERPSLAALVDSYLHVVAVQLSRTIACTAFHEVQARLARWLLLIHDRARVDHLHLTHESLAAMLGVQRSAVTIAAGALHRGRAISYARGEISILSRKRLEAVSCECYGAVIDDYDCLLA